MMKLGIAIFCIVQICHCISGEGSDLTTDYGLIMNEEEETPAPPKPVTPTRSQRRLKSTLAPKSLTASTGTECISECRQEGSSSWCHSNDVSAGWDYCERAEEGLSGGSDLTSHGLKCLTDCIAAEGSGHTCTTVPFQYKSMTYAWDYCSPQEGLDYKGRECTNSCGYHGYSYKFCYVKSSTFSVKTPWGYC